MASGMTSVYVATVDIGRPIKVGVSLDPASRAKALRCPETGLRPRVACVVPGGRDAEMMIHDMLTRHRIRDEWYRASAWSAALDMMGVLARGPDDLRRRVTNSGMLGAHARAVVADAQRARVATMSHVARVPIGIDAAIAIVEQSDRRDLPRLLDAIHAALVPS